MKITARKVAPDVYSVSFDETEIVLEGGEIKALLRQLMLVMTPVDTNDVKVVNKDDRKRTEFLNRICNANDVGIQKLLLIADHKDLLAMLKCGEKNTALYKKFFSNMSTNNTKMFNEDLAFEFRDGLSDKPRQDSLDRLIKLTRQLEQDGDLVFKNVGNG